MYFSTVSMFPSGDRRRKCGRGGVFSEGLRQRRFLHGNVSWRHAESVEIVSWRHAGRGKLETGWK